MRLRRLAKVLGIGAAIAISLLLAALLATKVALDRVPRYQTEIRAWVFRQTGLRVRFSRVAPALRWYGPELSFRDLELRSADDRRVLAKAASGRIGIDVWRVLTSGRLFTPRIDLDSPTIVIARTGPERFSLTAGIGVHDARSTAAAFRPGDLPPGILSIRNGRLTVTGWNRRLPQLILDHVDFFARRDAGTVQVSLDARLPAALGGALRFGGLADGLDASDAPRWRATLAARGMSFAGWRRLLPDTLGHLRSGSGAFRLVASGVGRDLSRASFDFSATRIVARASGGALARFDRIAGHLQLTHTGDRWSLAGRRVQAQRDGRIDPPSRFDVSWRGIRGGGLDLHAHASYLRADNLLPLAALLPQNSTRARLIALAPTGEWRDASLSLDRANSRAPWRFRVRARFHNAGIAAFGRSPGVHGLSGVLAGDQNAGHVAFASRSLIVDWPAQWPRPIGVDTLAGTVFWSRTPAGLLIATPRLAIGNADGQLAVVAAVRLPGASHSPWLDLVGRLRDGRLADASLYLPRATLHPKTLAWLDQAFLGGRVPSGEVVLRGPVRHFPFRDGRGEFLAHLQVEGAAVRFANGWPAMRDAAADVRFHDQGLTVRVGHATIDRLPITAARVRFADFRDAVLTARAEASGDAATALRFLRDSPINGFAHGGFAGWHATGTIGARVHLMFPFKDFAHRRVAVNARLQGVTIGRRGVPFVASDLGGGFTVSQTRIVAADVAGRLLGGPLWISARPARIAASGTRLDFDGIAHGAAIATAIGLPSAGRLDGATAWHARLTILDAPARERRLRLESDLDGLGIQLPAPLDKPADRREPLSIDVHWPRASAPRVDFALGTLARGALEWQASDAGARFARAAIGFGGAAPRFGPDEVLDLRGRIARLDLRGWSRFLPGGGRDAGPSRVRVGARLRIGEVDYAALGIRDLDLDLAATDGGWRVTLGGPNTDGTVRVPAMDARTPPWDFDFAKLDVIEPTTGTRSPGSAAMVAAPHVDPSRLPAARIRVGRLTWAGRRIGAVHARVSAVADGLVLDDMTVTGRSFAAHLRGDWRGTGTGRGHLVGALTSSNVEETMADLGYVRVIAGKTGRVDFDLRWDGVPTVDAFRQAGGQVKVALVHGQIFDLKPGAGRVLGLASIAALPRRLALDFSDVTDKGLAFDRVDGTFTLRGGNAYTNDVLLKGPAAQIGVIGRIGLRAQDYDQIAIVTNRIGSTLPLAGALAGGPVVGAAVLLFTEVFKQPLQGLERGYYRISGTWTNPKVESIDHAAAAAAIAKARKKDGK
jgi:uncharacterized protein (TIGR02099 family)